MRDSNFTFCQHRQTFSFLSSSGVSMIVAQANNRLRTDVNPLSRYRLGKLTYDVQTLSDCPGCLQHAVKPLLLRADKTGSFLCFCIALAVSMGVLIAVQTASVHCSLTARCIPLRLLSARHHLVSSPMHV